MKTRLFNSAFRITTGLLLLAAPVTAAERVLMQETFEGPLAPGWSWIREHTNFWRLRDGALEIRVEPGHAETVRNALVRPTPDRRAGKIAIEVTVRNLLLPTQQFEQAGITWYHNGKPVFKLVKELVDGQICIIPGRNPVATESVQLRLVIDGNTYLAQFRPEGKGEFVTVARGELPSPGDDQVSLQCYHGPPDREHWIRFDDFRILKLE